MAPACTTEFFNKYFAPYMGTKKGKVRVEKLFIYNLSKTREKDDVVSFELFGAEVKVYFKSLLYLVSNAFEEEPEQPLAGMQTFEDRLSGEPIVAHAGIDKITQSESHGGFDNDAATMNTILERILGTAPQSPFKQEELIGF
jgi:hypothetical protein